MTENDSYQVERQLDASALKALSHPLRLEIYDLLSQYGPQTSSSLAERVGESSGVTSYHLRELAKHNLIEEAEGLGTARERFWRRPKGSVSMGGAEARKTPAGRLASTIVVEEFYRRRHEELLRYLRTIEDIVDDDDIPALLSTSSVSMTDEQFGELSDRITALISETVNKYRDQTGEGVRRFMLRTDIFPLSPFDSKEPS